MKKQALTIGLSVLTVLALTGCSGAAPSLMDPAVVGLPLEVETFESIADADIRGSFQSDCFELAGLIAELQSEAEFVNGQLLTSDDGLILLFKEVNFRLPSAERAKGLVGEIGAAGVRCDEGSSRINFDELGGADVGVAWEETQTFDLFDVSIDFFSVKSVSSNGRYFTFYSSTAEEASGLGSNNLVRIASFAVSD